ncbi:MAG: SDR family NAD(P)-dependent oxidoreductase [Thermoguttaceae bacterium]|nr:SDR family NAD(P)-dependent oxidoreductase [Thermoguttaceae bacterium]MDW8078864.1 SDR family NAD(P)-dependent oxidoreductase [Thermoguttaceae bacterium]
MRDISERLARLTPAQRRLLEERLAKVADVAEPIAIVGMACRFPKAPTLDDYWRIIIDGVDATGEIPPERWDVEAFYDPDPEAPGKMYTRWGGFIDGVDQFDPLFFGIAPREASRMDPQQRVLLEVAWEALENAGIAADRLAGSLTGVFVGIGGTDYSKIPTHFENHFDYIDAHVGTGNALSIAANRISYVLDLRGPSFIVDTACSSALLAVHLAIQSLRLRECHLALAGGVNLILSPEVMIAFSKARMLSPTGKCRPFDAAADGYVRGEGCGIIVLKRLSDALRDGDNIWAVLKGSATNQDGRTSGITAPNARSQQEVIRAALANAGISPRDVTYIEAHGTGTPLGDPIEIQGLSPIFRRQNDSDPPCYLTSVKANIGHTETASGIAGVIKVALMMRHGMIPGQLHLRELNPNIRLDGTRLVIPREPSRWSAPPGSRVAGVSSYGFGGTNVHIVMQDYVAPSRAQATPDRPTHVFTLSAKSSASLQKLAGRFKDYLKSQQDSSLADLCHTVTAGRSHFNHRLAIVASSVDQLAQRLDDFLAGRRNPSIRSAQVRLLGRPKIVFLFTGQGSQYVDMGLQLYETSPTFREALDKCDEILREFLPRRLLSVIYPQKFGDGGKTDPSLIDETLYTQPALFALEYALARLWMSWGIEPDYVLGHSVGEYVAACVAGVFPLEDGLKLIAHRARLMAELPRDGMMAVLFTNEANVREATRGLEAEVAIAAVNGPENTVLSGRASVVEELVRQFQGKGIGVHPLAVSHAFHSPLMEPILDRFEAVAREIQYHPPNIPLVSNVTGKILDTIPDAGYWREHIRRPVLFARQIATLAEEKPDIWLEVGPAPVLLGMARRCVANWRGVAGPSLRRGHDDWEVLLGTIAELYIAGAQIDWRAFDRDWPRRRLEAPSYPFDRGRYWFEAKSPARLSAGRSLGPTVHPLLGSRVPTPLSQRIYEVQISSRQPAYLGDHKVEGTVVFPAAGFLEIGLAVARELFGPGRHAVENLALHQALGLPEGTKRTLQVTVSADAGAEAFFEVYGGTPAGNDGKFEWVLHASGKVVAEAKASLLNEPPPVDLARLEQGVIDRKSREEFYQLIAARKLQYGPAFQGIDHVRRREQDALAVLAPTEEVRRDNSAYILHPAWLDASFHIVSGVVPPEPDGSYSPHTYLPTFVRALRILGDPSQAVYTYAIRRSTDTHPSPPVVEADVYWLDQSGRVVVQIEGFRVERLGRVDKVAKERDPSEFIYRLEWKPVEEPDRSQARKERALPSFQDSFWVLIAERSPLASALIDSLSRQEANWFFIPIAETREEAEATQTTRMGKDVADARLSPETLSKHVWAGNRSELTTLLRKAAETSGGKQVRVLYLPPRLVDTLGAPAPSSIAKARKKISEQILALFQAATSSEIRIDQLAIVTTGVPWVATGAAEGDGHTGVTECPVEATAGPRGSFQSSTTQGVSTRQTACQQSGADVQKLLHAAVWGFVRSASLEYPNLNCTIVDIDPAVVPGEASDIFLQRLAFGEEPQLVIRGDKGLVPRIVPAPEWGKKITGDGIVPPRRGPFRIRLQKTGTFDGLRWETFSRQSPGPGQVEIEVHAAGLNFSDVLKALGLYPGISDPVVPLGIECSGVVTAVGEGVERFSEGDEVFGVAPFSFASHALSAEYALAHKPKHLSHVEAATIPITFLTAYYALVYLARLQPGERVLIHAGAGGVGLAAIQIAQHIGAEIFATAGSERKRQFLRELGVRHVLDSRSTAFADEIRRLTGFEGVDVVLNSLPGEMMTASLGVLRAYGRFLEIGKIDIYQNRMIGLAPFKDNLSYFAIDLDRLLRQRPELVRKLLAEVLEHFQAGHYRPLPITEFPAEELPNAFRFMAQRKNIGKIVIRMKSESEGQTASPSDWQQIGLTSPESKHSVDTTPTPSGKRGPEQELAAEAISESTCARPRIRGDATYLITGGLGALGLQVAQFLADRGATFLALLARRSPSPEARQQIHQLEARGTRVAVLQGDVTDRQSLEAALAALPKDFPPIAGVIHAAGVLEDCWLRDLNEDSLARPLAPKVDGAWNLWECLGDRVDFWIFFSSVASVLGSPGQTNYAAGNAFLDGLAHWLVEKGIPALVVNWGPWADGGMAAGDAMARSLEARGLRLLFPAIALEALDRLLTSQATQAIVGDFDWDRLQQALGGRRLPILQEVVAKTAQPHPATKEEVDREFLATLREHDETERVRLLEQYFARELARIMGLEAGNVDPELPLSALGLDSLMAMELKNNLEARLNFSLPMASFVENPSIRSLAVAAAAVLSEKQVTPEHAEPGRAESWTPIVTLCRGPERPPLFCLHPLAGDSRCYLHLARELNGRWPIYALEARGADGRRDPYSDGEEMLQDYLAAIRRVNPSGPYLLAGWSAGGIIALELARRLRDSGNSVGLLAFIDTPLPSIYDSVDLSDEAKFLCDLVEFTSHFSAAPIQLSYEALRHLPREKVFEAALQEAKRQGAVPPEASPQFIRRLCDVGRNNVTFIKNYRLRPIDLEIAMFLPAERGRLSEMSGQELRPDLGWSTVEGQKFRIIEVPGDHFSMLEPPHVSALATALLAELEKASQVAEKVSSVT